MRFTLAAVNTLSLAAARRIALAAQGFADKRPARTDVRHFRRALDHMSIVQLDAVNVLCRSHFLPFFARLGAYDRARLDDWLWRSGENHESLGHEASITKMDHYPLLQHKLTAPQWKSLRRFRAEHPDYLEAVKAEIKRRGPLSVKELSEAGARTGPWWGWSKGKIALEVLYRAGELCIAERTDTFLTRYDLPDRVVPKKHRTGPGLDEDQARRGLLRLAARSLGIGTEKDLADYFRLKAKDCRPLLQDLVAAGELVEVRVEGWRDPAYLHSEAKRPRRVRARALLSPFDPVVWCRPRTERLFDFRYRIEIYVPEQKRQHGYYVLPFLLDDQLVGRVDLKADRKANTLRAKAVHLEPGHDPDRVAPELAQSLREMAGWLDLDEVSVGRRGNLCQATRRALRAAS